MFEKMALDKAREGGLVEKTIFILKPIYVPTLAPKDKEPKNPKLKFRKKKQRN